MEGRCAACGARDARSARRPGWLRCGWCGLAVRREAWGGALDFRRTFRPPRCGQPFEARGNGWFADRVAAPSLATAFGFDLRGEREGEPLDHDWRAATGGLVPLRRSMPRSITLAVMARPGDPRLRPLVETLAPLFAETVVAFDGKAGLVLDGVRVLEHPLAGDFGAQRNRMQRAARSRWVLHLDTDESLTSGALATLEALAARADRCRIEAVALPRINRVDGRASDLFPDVQYRLVRASQRFRGQVHERVEATADWRTTMVARSGAILHHLDRAHVLARTRTYDALGQDRERRGDEAALLRPYEGRAPAGWTRLR